MELPNNEWNNFYKESIENRKDISWIRKEMDRHNIVMENCLVRVNELEVNQGVQRGKVVFLAATITAVLTIFSNAALWVFSHAGGAK